MRVLSQQKLANFIPPIGAVIVSDLDGCAIDSSHRQNTLEDGTLDLQNWRENSTPKMIRQDRLTLWGKRLAELKQTRPDLIICVCTSRVMQKADIDYLHKHLKLDRFSGLIWSRGSGCGLPDYELKQGLLVKNIFGNIDLTLALNLGKMFFIDDVKENVNVAEQLGLQAILATNGVLNND